MHIKNTDYESYMYRMYYLDFQILTTIPKNQVVLFHSGSLQYEALCLKICSFSSVVNEKSFNIGWMW